MPKGTELEAGSSKTSVGGSTAAKKSTQQGNPGQKTMTQKKGSAPNKDAPTGKKDNSQAQEEQGRGGQNDVGNPDKNYFARDRSTQTENNTFKGVVQEGQGP
jgi:hypothetical protein